MDGLPKGEFSVLISTAYAQAAGGSAESQLVGFLPIILMFVVLYFLMIRPQMKRNKEHRAMMGALKKGDEVITAGGMVGRITKVSETYVTIEIAQLPETKPGQEPQSVEVSFQKSAVQTLLPNGTIKAI
jgi:preprotein translocase subunit YajC